MDSIVDAFMPLINSFEVEVESVDDLVSGMANEFRDVGPHTLPETVTLSAPQWLERLSDKWTPPLFTIDDDVGEKTTTSKRLSGAYFTNIRFAVSASKRWCRRAMLASLTYLVRILKLERRRKLSSRMQTLLKMSRTRRIIILLARLLGPKSEILGHLRKRFMNGELAAQLSDVQGLDKTSLSTLFHLTACPDHIFTMQHSLAYYERVLSHAHPAYLSFLSVSLSQAKSGSDEAILLLSVVSIGTVCLQFIIGKFFPRTPRGTGE